MTRGPKKDAIFEPVPRKFKPRCRTSIIILVIFSVLCLAYAGWSLYPLNSGNSPTKPKTSKPYPCTATVLYHGTGQTHTCTLIRAFTDYEDGQCWVGGRSGIFTIYTTANGFKASSNWTMTSCIPLTEAKATQ